MSQFQPSPSPWLPPQPRAQTIKTYHGSMGFLGLGGPAEKAFKKDAAKMAKQGWRILNVTASGMLLGKPRTLVVVYER